MSRAVASAMSTMVLAWARVKGIGISWQNDRGRIALNPNDPTRS
jgi:hypothetical protein